MSTHSVAPELSPAVLPESPLVPNARLREIYTLMLQCRAFSLRVGLLAAEGRVAADLLPPAGEEAVLAATAVELRLGDTLCCGRRDWLPAAFKGVPLAKMVRWLVAGTGKRALSDEDHRFYGLPARPEAQLTAVLERAVAHKRRKGSLALAFLGGDVPVAAWEAALAVAGRRRLPLLLVCRTGSGQPDAHDFSALTLATQTPHIHVDGTDALALYRVVQEATGRARRGLGATLIEARIEGAGLEGAGLAQAGLAQAPAVEAGKGSGESSGSFASMERHLMAKGVFSTAWKAEVEQAFAQKLEAALAPAMQRKSALPAAEKISRS